MDGEIVARVERRRHWTPGEKAALLAEIEASGGHVSTVARRHGVSKSLLYNWRSASKAAALAARGAALGSAGFIGQWQGFAPRVHTGAVAPWRDGRNRAGS